MQIDDWKTLDTIIQSFDRDCERYIPTAAGTGMS